MNGAPTNACRTVGLGELVRPTAVVGSAGLRSGFHGQLARADAAYAGPHRAIEDCSEMIGVPARLTVGPRVVGVVRAGRHLVDEESASGCSEEGDGKQTG